MEKNDRQLLATICRTYAELPQAGLTHNHQPRLGLENNRAMSGMSKTYCFDGHVIHCHLEKTFLIKCHSLGPVGASMSVHAISLDQSNGVVNERVDTLTVAWIPALIVHCLRQNKCHTATKTNFGNAKQCLKSRPPYGWDLFRKTSQLSTNVCHDF